jgi:PAS domain S-box-containing protein/putative nucleotidyltransferase with HDIG domain
LISGQIFQQVNLRICEMTGYDQPELIGQHIQIIFPSQQHFTFFERDISRQIKNMGSGTIETRWQQKNGEIIDVLLNAPPVDAENWDTGITITVLDITERKQNEARIQRQLRRLAALNQVDAAITGNLGLDRVISILLEQVTRQLNVSAAAVLRYKPPTQTLEYYSGYGFYTDSIKKSKLRLGQDLAGKAALERRIIQVMEPDPILLNAPPFTVEGFHCYFGVPLIARGQIKGVLEVFNHEPLDPSSGWLSFLETIAGQAAIAIDNAEMVDNLERSNLELRLAYNNTLEGWAKALELRDFETEGHSRRVTELTIQVAQGVGIPNEKLVHVQRGALLHDIGKMGIPDHILLKNGPLDENEWAIMRQHPVYAYEMLSTIDFLKPAMDIPRYHHEKWDGTGYPYGLKGEEIPLAARVFAVIDVWDALSNDRPYRTAWPQDKIMDLIQAEKGRHFDPKVVEVFESVLKQQSSVNHRFNAN